MESRHGHGKRHRKHHRRHRDRHSSGDDREPPDRSCRDVHAREPDSRQSSRSAAADNVRPQSPMRYRDHLFPITSSNYRENNVKPAERSFNGLPASENRNRNLDSTPSKDRLRRGSADSHSNADTPPKCRNQLDIDRPSGNLKNYKMLVDPVITRGATKLYRFNGIVPGGDGSKNLTNVCDPRPVFKRHRVQSETLDLPVPRFRIDSNFVGEPPAIEVTLSNLNDNADKTFIGDLGSKYGEVDDVIVYYHPVTNRHLGIARIIFLEVSAAAQCVATLNGRSVMGKQIVVTIDPFGRDCQQMFDDLTTEKKPEAPPTVDYLGEETCQEDALHELIEDCSTKSDINTTTITNDMCDPLPNTVPLPDQFISLPNIPPPVPHYPSNLLPSCPHPAVSPFVSGSDFSLPPPLPFIATVPPPILRPGPPPPLRLGPPPPLRSGLPPIPQHPVCPTIPIPPPFVSTALRPPVIPPPNWTHLTSSQPPPRWNIPLQLWDSQKPSAEPDIKSPPPIPSKSSLNSNTTLNLDDRIEMLLKENFLAIDISDEKVKKGSSPVMNGAGRPNSLSDVSDGDDSPPPLPPGDEDDYLPALNGKHPSEESHMRLASQKDVFEAVSVPSNPYSTFAQSLPSKAATRPCNPPSHILQRFTPPPFPFQKFVPPPRFSPAIGFLPQSFSIPPPSLQQHCRMTPPVALSPMPSQQYYSNRKPIKPLDPAAAITDIALEEVISLLTATLEKDILKKMTEVLVFNELEKWWADEEKKHNIISNDDKKKNDANEKQTATDSIINAIIDSRYDQDLNSPTVGFGFRACLPKMPSFRRKLPTPVSKNIDPHDRNESDEEEMVKQSDSEEGEDDPEPMMTIKRRETRNRSISSESSDSFLTDSDSVKSDLNSETDLDAEPEENLTNLIDFDLMERMREKTPSERATPVPSENWYSSDDSLSSDTDKLTKLREAPISDGHRRVAMEALSVLGLDEFVCDIKFRASSPKKASQPEQKLVFEQTPSLVKTQIVEDPVDNYLKERESPVAKSDGEQSSDTLSAEEIVDDVDDKKKPLEDVSLIPTKYIPIEHNYFKPNDLKTQEKLAILDHGYATVKAPIEICKKFEETPTKDKIPYEDKTPAFDVQPVKQSKEMIKNPSPQKAKEKIEKKRVSPVVDKSKRKYGSKNYRPRESLQEMMTCYEFLTKGLDQEDSDYLQAMYDVLLNDENESYWLNDVHWVSHPNTLLSDVPSKRHRFHITGCARTEGYYKVDPREKQKHKHHYNKNRFTLDMDPDPAPAMEPKTYLAASREARSNQRRLLTAFGTANDSDLLKFNQLKFRKKQLKFGKSEIHDWGLFAMEAIAADEMVIEYVGQKIRCALADFREQVYEKRGIGSSYLFRIDAENIVDATHSGNLSRFINHNCDPNCYAKIITIEGKKKIVIYSKRDIAVGEEITYDYKFPLEEEKIKCLCGAIQCKGFLN